MADRMAELLKRQFEKQSAAGTENASAREASESRTSERLEAALEQLVEQQRQTNEHLRQQRTSQEANIQELRDWRAATQRSFAQTFFRKMALEVPPVVLAVLLAFGINSWWQNSKQEHLTRIARENIVREIQINAGVLENNIQGNQRRVAEVRRSIQQLTEDPTDTADMAVRGMELYTLTEAAWESAGLSGSLSNLDQDFMMNASKLYRIQLSRNSQTAGAALAMKDIETRKPENLLAALLQNELVLQELIHIEEFLLQLYNKFLEKYDPTTLAE